MNTELTRRDILRGIGLGAGATLLSPILGQIAAHAAGDAKAANRKRVVFIIQSNGMNPAHLVPSGVTRLPLSRNRSSTEKFADVSLKGRTLHEALEPLTPFMNRLTLVQGLSSRIATAGHSTNHGMLGCYPSNKGAMDQTIDHAVADAIPGIFKHVGLGMLSPKVGTMNYNLSASAKGQESPIICSLEVGFKSLFGSVAAEVSKKEFDHTSNLLDFMADDVKRTRSVLRGDEKQKLDHYLEAFETLHTRQTKIAEMREELTRRAPKLGDKLTSNVTSTVLEAQFETGAAALISGLTNVLLLSSGGGKQYFGNFPEFGIPDLHHIGHGGTYGDRSSQQCFIELRKFHTKLIAGFAQRLADVPEGNGTMLDNTVIVYLSDSAEGHHPNCYQWPVVLLGNLGGALKPGGRYIDYPAYGMKGHRTLANLYCTLLHAVGKPRDTFGVADVGLKDFDQTGPLTEVLS